MQIVLLCGDVFLGPLFILSWSLSVLGASRAPLSQNHPTSRVHCHSPDAGVDPRSPARVMSENKGTADFACSGTLKVEQYGLIELGCADKPKDSIAHGYRNS